MLLVLRIVTIIVAGACLIAGGVLIGAGILDEPQADMSAVWMGAGIFSYFLADLYLLYRSYRKKHAPAQWVAFILAIMPAMIILGIVWAADSLEGIF